MPTKRSRRTRTYQHVTLRSIDVADQLRFLSAWRPPTFPHEKARARWLTWEAFLAEYEQVRDEFLERWPTRHDGRLPFAERLRNYVREHGDEVLDDLQYYEIADDPDGEDAA